MNDRFSFQLLPSRTLTGLLTSVHAITGLGVWLAPLAPGWKVAVSLVLTGALWMALRQHAWRVAAGSVVALDVRADCSVCAHSRVAGPREYEVAPGTFVSPFLTVLGLAAPGGRVRFVLILPDGIDPDSFRRLRVWLLCRCNSRAARSGSAPTGSV